MTPPKATSFLHVVDHWFLAMADELRTFKQGVVRAI